MEYRFVTFEQYRLPYLTFGTGTELLLAFHGYNREGSDFSMLAEKLGDHYTIVAFDLFYHGVHASKEELPPVDNFILVHLIEQLLWDSKFVRFSMIGYSMGGRVAMAILQKMPHRVKGIYLLSPDGLKIDFHEEFVTGTIAGDILFRYLINNPALYFNICRLLRWTGLLEEKLFNFINSNMETKEKRLHVYRTWNILKKLKPELKVVAHHANTRKIKVILFMGKNDRIIKPSLAKRLSRRLKGEGNVYLLDAGHRILQKSDEIADIILKS